MEIKGLFINCVEANDSIHESGNMVFQCLSGSEKYSLDYIEIGPENLTVPTRYDFYFFNYHFGTMAWLETSLIKDRLPGVKFNMVLEVSPNDPFVCCSPDDFDVYCVLDPTLNIVKENVFSFPRPLETPDQNIVYEPSDVPVIGSFGFATPGKGFEHVIDAVNREFDSAIVRINIPYSTYMDESGECAKQLAAACKNKAKDGVSVMVTHDYMTKAELIKWCGQNTLNCFLYDRNQPGLAATTDQAITSGRPLIISKNNTFRHIQKYIKPFPYQTLKDAIKNTQKNVEELQYDWSPRKFRERFEEILDQIPFDNGPALALPETVELPVKSDDLMTRIRKKVAIRTRLRKLGKSLGVQLKPRPRREPEPESLPSYARFGEDLIVYNLLRELSVQNISYLDIGGSGSKSFNNTKLFYEQGCSGVLVERNPSLCVKLRSYRPRDIVLNAEIGIQRDAAEAVGSNGTRSAIQHTSKEPPVSISQVILNYFTECPDFISIEVDGLDLQFLETLDFEKHSPAIFCIETLANSTYESNGVRDFLNNQGYFPYKETHSSTIFLNKNLYEFYLYQLNTRNSKKI